MMNNGNNQAPMMNPAWLTEYAASAAMAALNCFTQQQTGQSNFNPSSTPFMPNTQQQQSIPPWMMFSPALFASFMQSAAQQFIPNGENNNQHTPYAPQFQVNQQQEQRQQQPQMTQTQPAPAPPMNQSHPAQVQYSQHPASCNPFFSNYTNSFMANISQHQQQQHNRHSPPQQAQPNETSTSTMQNHSNQNNTSYNPATVNDQQSTNSQQQPAPQSSITHDNNKDNGSNNSEDGTKSSQQPDHTKEEEVAGDMLLYILNSLRKSHAEAVEKSMREEQEQEAQKPSTTPKQQQPSVRINDTATARAESPLSSATADSEPRSCTSSPARELSTSEGDDSGKDNSSGESGMTSTSCLTSTSLYTKPKFGSVRSASTLTNTTTSDTSSGVEYYSENTVPSNGNTASNSGNTTENPISSEENESEEDYNNLDHNGTNDNIINMKDTINHSNLNTVSTSPNKPPKKKRQKSMKKDISFTTIKTNNTSDATNTAYTNGYHHHHHNDLNAPKTKPHLNGYKDQISIVSKSSHSCSNSSSSLNHIPYNHRNTNNYSIDNDK